MIRFFGLFLALCASGAAAEVLKVTSGDHPGFTRIVVLTSPGLAVSLSSGPDEATLTFAGGPHRFDLTDAFRRIGRSRVTEMNAENDQRLRLALGCPCIPVLGTGGPGIVTIDITDAPQASDSPDDKASAGPPTTRPPVRRSLPPLQNGLMQAGRKDPGLLLTLSRDRMGPADSTTGLLPLPDLETARGLQFQIARAVSQGLLDPAQTQIKGEAPAPNRSHPPEETDRMGARLFASRPGVQVSAQTPLGQGLLDQIDTAQLDRQAVGCLSAETVGLPDWGQEDRFQNDLGQMQRDVFTETGRVDAAAARQLARHFLFFGMGAEARATLKAADQSKGEDAPLLAMAEIMENGSDTRVGAFHNQGHCETPAALWAVLADPAPSVASDAQIGAVIQGFTALPWHLKDHLGPLLAERLRASGNLTAAETVLRIIKRATDETSPALKLQEAEMSLVEKAESEALVLLNEVAVANGQLSPEALVRMIDIEVAAGRSISEETALLAESYALEYRRTPIADDLWRVNVLALAGSGQFAKAFGMLQLATNPEAARDLWAATLDALTRDADDLAFARWTLNVPADVQANLAPETANAVASRLIGLGFVGVAEPFLAASAEGAAGRSRKLLRAEIALALNRPRRAEVELTGLSGADSDLLRADARLAMGDFETSQQLFRSLEAPGKEVRAAFLAGNWDRVQDAGEAEVAAFGALALETAPEVPVAEDPAPLAAGRNLLDDSARARAVVSGMLARMELQDESVANPDTAD